MCIYTQKIILTLIISRSYDKNFQLDMLSFVIDILVILNTYLKNILVLFYLFIISAFFKSATRRRYCLIY